MTTAIVWFRNDLRVADHPALHHAAASGARVLPVYIHAPEELAPWQPGSASRWWLHHSLHALRETLARLGATLVIRRGASADCLRQLAGESGAREVHWNRAYEPAAAQRDRVVTEQLTAAGIACRPHHAALLFEPGSVLAQTGRPYQVFTPFWHACQRQAASPTPLGSPHALPPPAGRFDTLTVDALGLLPSLPWYTGLHDTWRPGESAAHQRLQAFCQSALADYPHWRDFPDRPGTSRLSPYLHFGEITPQQITWTLRDYAQRAEHPGIVRAVEAVLRQLVWREFAHHILHHFPHTADAPLNPRFRDFPWRHDPALLRAWQLGHTGVPIVDAGMRQLWQTGWMHNRVRMLVASFLVKNCRIHWREGARWFWDTLIDADLANNSLNWQWVAGCGADAAPYHRIFNPVLQGEKFDRNGRYVRRWLPELAALPDRWLHQPWLAPRAELAAAGVQLGRDYPEPVVDLAATRRQALALFRGADDPPVD